MWNKDQLFIDIAKLFAKQSTCISKQVGGVLIKDDRIIYSGYNGVPSGHQHCNQTFGPGFNREQHHLWSNDHELHCEQNIISGCAKKGIITDKAELYITLSPCVACAKIIIAAGITKVIFLERYDKKDGLEFLEKNNVYCDKIKE